MTNTTGDMAETSVTYFFARSGHQCLDPTVPQKWSGPDQLTGWKLTPITYRPTSCTENPEDKSRNAAIIHKVEVRKQEARKRKSRRRKMQR